MALTFMVSKLTYTGQLESSTMDYRSPLCHTLYAALLFPGNVELGIKVDIAMYSAPSKDSQTC